MKDIKTGKENTYRLGAKVIPMSDNCKNFCFKHGCMGEKR